MRDLPTSLLSLFIVSPGCFSFPHHTYSVYLFYFGTAAGPVLPIILAIRIIGGLLETVGGQVGWLG